MNKNQALLKFDEEFVERLCKDIFPNDQLPRNFEKIKTTAFKYCSVAFIQQNFGIGWKEFKAIKQKKTDYTLYEINLINTIILTRTEAEIEEKARLGLGFKKVASVAFDDVMDTVEEMRLKYESIVNPIKESIQRKIEIMSNTKGNYKESPVKFIK